MVWSRLARNIASIRPAMIDSTSARRKRAAGCAERASKDTGSVLLGTRENTAGGAGERGAAAFELAPPWGQTYPFRRDRRRRGLRDPHASHSVEGGEHETASVRRRRFGCSDWRRFSHGRAARQDPPRRHQPRHRSLRRLGKRAIHGLRSRHEKGSSVTSSAAFRSRSSRKISTMTPDGGLQAATLGWSKRTRSTSCWAICCRTSLLAYVKPVSGAGASS